MRSPKIKAFLSQIESGKLNSDKARVLNQVFIANGVTSWSLEKRLNKIKPTTILARLSDLEDAGFIYKAGQRLHLGNEQPYSIFKYEADEDAQELNALKRRMSKFEAWKKRGLFEFSEFLHRPLRQELNQTQLF